MAPRTLPATLVRTWDNSTTNPDPLVALAASQQLWKKWVDFQEALVSEALRADATWDDIGRTLGTSRQAAWARFKDAAAGTKREDELKQEAERVKEVRERIRSLQA